MLLEQGQRQLKKNVTAFQDRKIHKHTTKKAQPSGPVWSGGKRCKLCSSHENDTSSESQDGTHGNQRAGGPRGIRVQEQASATEPRRGDNPKPRNSLDRHHVDPEEQARKSSGQSRIPLGGWENKVVLGMKKVACCRCCGRTEGREHACDLIRRDSNRLQVRVVQSVQLC